ncbi:hypothetical protein ElyMa_005424800 [Elysia marginata]|uniref:Uncharacterized protein n=1 Tax=Elysia marginata TaxID=1093978 RepID=A0AAV4EKF8_9GAST|nr:hypothetical protein ElyMa_005424800 [Elysia marginata]
MASVKECCILSQSNRLWSNHSLKDYGDDKTDNKSADNHTIHIDHRDTGQKDSLVFFIFVPFSLSTLFIFDSTKPDGVRLTIHQASGRTEANIEARRSELGANWPQKFTNHPSF